MNKPQPMRSGDPDATGTTLADRGAGMGSKDQIVEGRGAMGVTTT